jgi:hypothetical protein
MDGVDGNLSLKRRLLVACLPDPARSSHRRYGKSITARKKRKIFDPVVS